MNKFVSGLAALSALAMVAGCATDDMVTGSSVTRFHLGQPIARGPIAVESVTPGDANSLEFAQISASVARELTRLGWTVVPNNASEQVAMVSLTQQSREAERRSGVSIGIGGGTGSYGRHGGVGVGGAGARGQRRARAGLHLAAALPGDGRVGASLDSHAELRAGRQVNRRVVGERADVLVGLRVDQR